MVIPWEAIASACSDMLEKQPQNSWNGIRHDNGFLSAVGMGTEGGSIKDIHGYLCAGPPPSSSIETATASICLITVDDGAWASGILLNKQGLILTNAHLLEPWRFGKASANGEVPKTKPKVVFTPYDQCKHPGDEKVGINSRDQGLPQTGMEPVDFSLKRRHQGFRVNPERSGNRSIRVRLDFMDPWIWTNAKVVHVSKGPLDVALLQLEFVPDQLCPIVMDFTCPSPGSKAYILGHGLFGPRCDFLPSACLGVIAKVVETKRSMHYQSTPETYFPAMLQTTAAVHPGGSGGAVVNSDGRMIGLVTSNAKHGGGTVIPHLNFSIPCAALEPIFNFSEDMQELSLLEYLDKPNEQLSSVWALAPPLSSKLGPSLLDLPLLPQDSGTKDIKGSRFAKFMADRDELLKNTPQPDKPEGSQTKFISSKL